MSGNETEPAKSAALEVSARELLGSWANKQAGWARMMVGEILETRGPVPTELVDRATDQFLAEKGLSDARPSIVPALKVEDGVAATEDGFVLTSIGDVEGVNALECERPIEFNPGLTVLFGENGSGKTGYTRILKTVAAVRTAEEILPNVHDQLAPRQPKATLKYTLGTDSEELHWTGQSGLVPFNRIGIFDSPAVQLHVDDELAYLYTPSDLALFKYANEAIAQVRDRVAAMVDLRRPQGNPFAGHFTKGTRVAAEIEALSAATDAEVLRALAGVPTEEAAEIDNVKRRLNALKGETLPAQIKVARDRRAIAVEIQSVCSAVQAFDGEAYAQAVDSSTEAWKDYSKLRADLQEAVGLEDAGEPWQAFIDAGEHYRLHRQDDLYPQPGDRCLYCQQELGPVAIGLLHRYRALAENAAAKLLKQSQDAADRISRPLRVVSTAELLNRLRGELEQGQVDDLLSASQAMIARFSISQADLEQRKLVDLSELKAKAADLVILASERIEAADQAIADLTTQADDRDKVLAETQSEHDSLQDRLELKKRLELLLKHLEDLKWVERATKIVAKVPPVLRSLTDESKVASEQLLNSDFERRFNEECAALRAPNVVLEFPGRRGQTARKKLAASHKPSAVLSEGEQKVIAMADFLAESSLRPTDAPIVFDDPVNSLDYRRIQEVTDRIALLAKSRQIIVFTHNIWFAAELLGRFEKENPDRCSYFAITDEQAKKGIVTKGSHPRWDTVKKTKGEINHLIQTASTVTGAAQDALIREAYSWIRTWCEVVVETELLAGVTQRYRANVSMGGLAKIRADRLDAAIAAINPIFDSACRYIEGHSQPLETLAVRPTLQTLRSDWTALQAARDEYLAK